MSLVSIVLGQRRGGSDAPVSSHAVRSLVPSRCSSRAAAEGEDTTTPARSRPDAAAGDGRAGEHRGAAWQHVVQPQSCQPRPRARRRCGPTPIRSSTASSATTGRSTRATSRRVPRAPPSRSRPPGPTITAPFTRQWSARSGVRAVVNRRRAQGLLLGTKRALSANRPAARLLLFRRHSRQDYVEEQTCHGCPETARGFPDRRRPRSRDRVRIGQSVSGWARASQNRTLRLLLQRRRLAVPP